MTLPRPDVQHASPVVVELLDTYFEAKSDKRLDDWIAQFAPGAFYADAVLGWTYENRHALHDEVAKFMPHWGEGVSYSTRIIGDETGAVVAVTDTPELFGNEIRSLSVVDFSDGGVARFIDYWDSRHFGQEAAGQMRTPTGSFPSHLGEGTVPSSDDTRLTEVVESLSAGLSTNDVSAVLSVFADDITFEDLTLRLQLHGKYSTGSFLERSAGRLPYAAGAEPVHIVGGSAGGGYEWRAPESAVKFGVLALELDEDGLVSRLTSVWDGGLVDDSQLVDMIVWSTDVVL